MPSDAPRHEYKLPSVESGSITVSNQTGKGAESRNGYLTHEAPPESSAPKLLSDAPDPKDAERRKYQAWASTHGYTVPELWIAEPNRVILSDAAFCGWEGWLACSQAKDAEIAALRNALQGLKAEVRGALGIARPEIVAAISETNVRCIERRVDEAERVLAKDASQGSGHGLETLPAGRTRDDGVAVQYRESPERNTKDELHPDPFTEGIPHKPFKGPY